MYTSGSQYGGRNTGYAYFIYTETGTNTEADSKSVNQTGPTDNLPSSSGAPGLALSSNREKKKYKGEKEKKKTGHRCEACRTQPHRQDEKTIHRDITLMVMTDCDVSGQDLRDGFIPTAVPAYCVSHKLSEIRLST